MKYILVFIPLLFTAFLSAAQSGEGKTYYDAQKTKIKEIYGYKTVFKVITDSRESIGSRDTSYEVKSGPYFLYYENGKLQSSGFYYKGQQDSTWVFYDPTGKELKRERYKLGQLIK